MTSKNVRYRQRARQKLKRSVKRAEQSMTPAGPPVRGAKAEPWPPGTSGNPAGSSRQRRSEAKLMAMIAARNAGLAVSEKYPDDLLAGMLLSGMLTGNIRLFRFGLALLEEDDT